jgi:hypothetical protein
MSMRVIQSVVVLIWFVCASCAPSPFPSNEQRTKLNTAASSLTKKREEWLVELPRKNTDMDVARKDLPESLKGMGFAEATVSDSYVILPKESNLREGVLVFTGRVVPLPFLQEVGVEITDTAYPEIKTVKMNLKVVR